MKGTFQKAGSLAGGREPRRGEGEIKAGGSQGESEEQKCLTAAQMCSHLREPEVKQMCS